MRAGNLRHKVSVEQIQVSRGTTGEEIETWIPHTTSPKIWCSISRLSGQERFDIFGAQEIASQIFKFTTRYVKGITPKHRLVFDSRNFDIQQVDNVDNRSKELHLYCEEIPLG